MALRLLDYIELPPNRAKGGFDHADIHAPTDRLYVAHTSNDEIDVIDVGQNRYVESISGLREVRRARLPSARTRRIPSRCLHRVQSKMRSKSPWAWSRMASHSIPVAVF